jgi:hypothetical protein
MPHHWIHIDNANNKNIFLGSSSVNRSVDKESEIQLYTNVFFLVARSFSYYYISRNSPELGSFEG